MYTLYYIIRVYPHIDISLLGYPKRVKNDIKNHYENTLFWPIIFMFFYVILDTQISIWGYTLIMTNTENRGKIGGPEMTPKKGVFIFFAKTSIFGY